MPLTEISFIENGPDQGTFTQTKEILEFEWKIEKNEFIEMSNASNTQLKSPPLRTTINGAVWNFCLYRPESSNGIFLIVCLQEADENIFARFKSFRLNSSDEQVKDRKILDTPWYHYSTANSYTQAMPLISSEDLSSDWPWFNDTMILNMTLEIKAVDPAYPSVTEEQSLGESLLKTLISEEYADVKLWIDEDQFFMAHRVILAARSSYFAELFKASPAEDSILTVTIEDTDYDVFVEVLNYIYQNKLPERVQFNARQFIAAGIKFKLAGFVTACEKQLCAIISFDNFTELLTLAYFYKCEDLYNRVVSFIQNNWDVVEQHDLWKSLAEEDPGIVLKVSYAIGVLNFEDGDADNEEEEI